MLSEALALTNALLVSGSILAGVAGYRAIHLKRVNAHRNLMLVAFACSALFLAGFVLRFVWFGFRPFEGEGAWKVVYYLVMFAHEPLAVISVPMVCVTLVLGLRRSKAHVELARPSAVVWLISATTGLLMYVVLYLLPVG